MIKLAKIRESIISSLHQGAPLPAWSTEGQHISSLCGPQAFLYLNLTCLCLVSQGLKFFRDFSISELL